MTLTTLLLCSIYLALLSYGRQEVLENESFYEIQRTCDQIAAAISGASQVSFPRECLILLFGILRSNGQSSCA